MWREKGEEKREFCMGLFTKCSLFNRFWLYIKLFAIISTAWIIDMRSGYVYNSPETFLISDVLKLYSAGLVAFLLIWSSRVHTLVFERYNTIKDNDIENNE
jgi:hypothetical protein